MSRLSNLAQHTAEDPDLGLEASTSLRADYSMALTTSVMLRVVQPQTGPGGPAAIRALNAPESLRPEQSVNLYLVHDQTIPAPAYLPFN